MINNALSPRRGPVPVLASVVLATSLLSPVKGEGLLAAWEFNGTDVVGADVSATDGTAANTTGILQGDAVIVDGALTLDGSGDYLQFGNDLTDLRMPGGTLTDATWVQTNSAVGGLRRIVEHEDNTYFWAENNIFQDTTHGTGGGTTGRALSTTAPTVGVWQHVLVTFAPNEPAKMYIDGVLEGTSSNAGGQNPIPNNTHTFQIGARRSSSGNPSNFWDGLIDDVGIWDCELEVADIERLAGVGAGGYEGRTSPTGLGEDCNGDGIPDSWYRNFGLDPCSATVGSEDPDGDGLTTFEEFGLGIDPTNSDTDGDGLSDDEEVNLHNTDPASTDTDGDGIEDGDEINAHSTDPNNPDSDGDGLSDGAELDIHLTDPNNPDSDGDGISDGIEIAAGTDPNDANDFPSIVVPEGLYLYYSFDDADITGDTVNDRAGNPDGPFDGTLTNGGPTTGGAGLVGQAAEFAGGPNNGDNHFVDLAPHAPAASILTEGSIAAWVKPDTTGLTTDVLTIMAISNSDLGTGEMRYWISNGGAFGTGTLAYQTRGGPQDASVISTGVNLFDGEWHHVAVTVDSTRTATLYVDGTANNVATIGFLDIPSANSMSVGRNKDATPGGGQWFYDGLIDDLGVWSRPLNAAEVAFIHNEGLAGRSALNQPLTGPGLDVRASGDDLVFSWDSQDGKVYNLRSETDPTAADPIDWPIFNGNENLAATTPENILTIPRPADPFRLFVIEEFNAPPVAVFADDLESGQGGWTTGFDDPNGNTLWELGTPQNVGPSAANSPTNCFGTNISGNYAFDADTWLRTPPIDLTTASGATLHYFQFLDIEEQFDGGSVAVLDASDNSELAVIQDPVDGVTAAWGQVTKALPAAALGKTIVIEFRLQTDDFGNFAGWYLDDIEITVP